MRPILLVDDNYDFRLMTRDQLERQGYQVISVGSGKEALEILLRQPVAVMVTDLHMPLMNGFELMRKVRAAGRLMPPVIAITGHEFLAGPEATRVARALGASVILTKPFGSARLFDAIENALNQDSRDDQRLSREEGAG